MRFATSTSLVALAAVLSTAEGASAQQVIRLQPTKTDVTLSNVNVLNLLSPFLDLNNTSIGQSTLQSNLSQSLAVNNNATPAQQAMAISDKSLLGSAAGSKITLANGMSLHVGIADNLAGGLPMQAVQNPADPTNPKFSATGSITPYQPVGGYGVVLGPIYQTGVRGSTATSGPLAPTANLLDQAYNTLTSADLGVAKNYFANGAANNNSVQPYYSLTAVAPSGLKLPTANGLPNTTNSVYDVAYGVTNTQANQDVYGSSRPVQVVPTKVNAFDPSAIDFLSTNPSFPSGHTTYAYTDSILLGMLTPQLYQSMLVRASEYGNSRIELGVHYALDIIASRSFVQYELAQAFTNPLYINNAANTGSASTFGSATTQPTATGVGKAIDMPSLFVAAQSNLQGYLQANLPANCGPTVAACATSAANTANDPYVPSAANQALYRQRLTYGLPTLTFAQAPQEAAPAGGPDASILLAPIYGGSTSAAATIAPSGGLNGTKLSTSTINAIIVNTETNALAAFYGTSLSYWSRIDLYSAAGYFSGTNGTLTLAPTDRLNMPVTVGGALGTGTLYGNGSIITGNVTTLAGSTFGGGSATAAATTRINGNLTLQPGAIYAVTASNNQLSSTSVSGTASIAGSKVTGAGTLQGAYALVGKTLPILTATTINGTFASTNLAKSVIATPVYHGTEVDLAVKANTITSQLAPGSGTNQTNVGRSINAVLATGKAPPAFVRLFALPRASLPQALSQLSGEIATTQVTTTILAGSSFLGTLLDPNIEGRGAPLAGSTPFLASIPEAAEYTGQVRYSKDGALPVAVARPTWSVWAAGTGLNADLDGDRHVGSHDVSIQLGGVAVGADYRVTPGLVMGFGLGGASTWAKLDGGLGSASSNIFQVGGYASQKFYGNGYLSGAFAYSNADGRTSRIAAVGGTSATLTGRPDTNLFGGRIEAGFRYGGFGFVGLTPYAAVEVQNADTGAYSESSSAARILAVRYQDKDSTNLRFEGGARFDLATGGFGSLFGRVAYVHQDLTPSATGLFEGGLAATPFTVNGAKLPADAALVALGSDIRLAPSLKLTAQALGELAPKATTVAGRLTLKYEF